MSTTVPHTPYSDSQAQRLSSLTEPLTALNDFRLAHPKEVYSELKQLSLRGDFITVSFGKSGQRIVSRIMHIDQDAGLLYYDMGATQLENMALLESEEQLFSATPGGVHVQFVCNDVKQTAYEGAPTFVSPLPESVYRMQRRENFRIETPVARPFMCHATMPDGTRIPFELVDLSVTGVRLRSADARLASLTVGTLFTEAVVDCQNLGTISADLVVAFFRNTRTATHPLFQIGCRFDNLLPRRENELQRMITTLELRRNRR